ncbi:hypothetical protein LJ754_11945 [Arthrobacter sp. zg-Y40]|nr:hypothetical protein [Arthrobacter sp. zg-Y40]MCC3279860.1 hypothetical protein [Arthrobacter sp. zg-Y40]
MKSSPSIIGAGLPASAQARRTKPRLSRAGAALRGAGTLFQYARGYA